MTNSRNGKSIVHLADYGGPYSGNFIASLLALEKSLKRSELRQVLVFSDIARDRQWMNELQNRNVRTYILPRQMSKLRMANEIARIAEQENAILLHTHFTQFDVSAWIAGMMLSIRGRNIKVIWHVHTFLPIKKTLRRRLKDFVKLRIMGKSVMTVVLSEEMRFSLIERGLKGRTVKILNGVDIIRATKSAKSREVIRHELGISDTEKLLVVFAWDPYRKGMDILLKAVEKISPEEKTVLLAVGDDELKKFIDDTEGNTAHSIVKHVRPRECVADFFRASDVFVSSSRWEGCPYSVMEAMVNGLPVISSDIDSVEWAKAAGGVVMYKVDDVDALIQEIRRVSAMREDERQELGESNRLFIKENHSAEVWAESIHVLYDKMLS